VSDRLDEFGDDTAVVLVTFTDATNLADYTSNHELPFPVLIDRDRQAYRAYGLGRGTIRRVWGLRAARRYLEIFRTAGLSGLARPTEDTLQLGGDFVIAPDGTLVYGFWGDGPDDRPLVDELIEAVRGVRP
jgi:alkyl-hydroperoxide reductase/thiol specific antioxidant family protein